MKITPNRQRNLLVVLVLLVACTVARSQPSPVLFAPRTPADLGRMLFFDPVLSGNYKRSCASCHRPQKGFTDQRAASRSFLFTGNLAVNTPTLLGATRQRQFFHDGRTNRLDTVIRAVLTNPAELNSSYALVATRLAGSADYQRWFRQFYRRPPSEQTINRALIAYLRSLSPRRSERRWVGTSSSDSVRAGQAVFVRLGCGSCHPAPYYRNERQYEVAPRRWVRTPTLRNLPLTPPYLADGTAPTLEAVLNGSFHARQQSLTPTDTRYLVHFLNAIPLDTNALTARQPVRLPAIAGAPPRRVGGNY